MKVSVVIPTYNRARLVTEALHSVLSQPFDDMEVLVVDDGSTDDTLSALARFTDSRLRVIHQANQGISGARNTGVREARGEYLAMLDSDDRWRPSVLPRLVGALDAHPDAVLVYGRAQAMDAYGFPLPQMKGTAEAFPGQTLRSILYGDFVPIIAALVRRDALLRAGPFDPDNLAEDWDMWVRLARLGQFVFVEDTLADFRQHESQFTRSDGERLQRLMASRVHVLDKAFAQPDLPPEVQAVRPLAYRNVYVTTSVRWLNSGALRPALGALREAFRYGHPVEVVGRVVYLTMFYRLVRRFHWVRVASDAFFHWRRERLRMRD